MQDLFSICSILDFYKNRFFIRFMSDLVKLLRPKKFCELLKIPPQNATQMKSRGLLVYDKDNPKLVVIEDSLRKILDSTYFTKYHPLIKSLLLKGKSIGKEYQSPKPIKKKKENSDIIVSNNNGDDVINYWRNFFNKYATDLRISDSLLSVAIEEAEQLLKSEPNAQNLKYIIESIRTLTKIRQENASLITTTEALMLLGLPNEIMMAGMRDIISKFCVDNNLDINANFYLDKQLRNLVDNITNVIEQNLEELKHDK